MDDFTLVGARPQASFPAQKKVPWYRGKPVAAYLVLGLIVLGCLLWSAFSKTDAGYMDCPPAISPRAAAIFSAPTRWGAIFSR